MTNNEQMQQKLGLIRMGMAIIGEPVKDGEQLDVFIRRIDEFVYTYQDVEKWRAWILTLKPKDAAKEEFKVRLFLDKGQDFSELGDGMRMLGARFSAFAAEAHGITEFGMDALVGAGMTVVHKRKNLDDKYSSFDLIQILDMPALNHNDADEPEAEQVSVAGTKAPQGVDWESAKNIATDVESTMFD